MRAILTDLMLFSILALEWAGFALISAYDTEYENQLKKETEVEQRQNEQRRS